MTKASLFCIGRIAGTHGVRGLVRVSSFMETPEDLFAYAPVTDETGARVFELTPRGQSKDAFLVAVKGVDDRTQAEALRGVNLYIDRALLPPPDEGEYFFADLVGLAAQDKTGKIAGRVEAVHDYGGGVFLEIKPAKGPAFMVPFKEAFVPEVDIKNGTLRFSLPDDWFNEEKPVP